MVEFKVKKVKTKTLGELLRREREILGVSLDEMARYTKVRKIYLEKIENDQLDDFLPDVYVKGFLRNYAKYLGLDPEKIILQYRKEKGIQKNIQRSFSPCKKETFFSKLPSITLTPNILASGIFIFLIFVGIFYFFKEVNQFSKTPRLIVTNPISNQTIKESNINVSGATDQGNQIFINGQPVFVSEKGEFSQKISLQKGLNKIVISVKNKFGKISTKEFDILADYEIALKKNKEEVLGVETEEEKTGVEIEVEIKEVPVWILVRADGKEIYNGTMLAESRQIFSAEKEIKITSGKADKTWIKFKGKEEAFQLGNFPGVIRDVVFRNENNVSDEIKEPSNDNENEENNSVGIQLEKDPTKEENNQ